MRHVLITILFSIGMLTAFGQQKVPTVSLQNENVPAQNNDATIYRLFPTQNTWNFIKLNTRNGQMWQVQFNMEENKRFVTDLNLLSLVADEKEANNRFTLYPTQNTWTFILLDQLDGRTWQVQWSFEAEKKMLLRID